MNNKGFTLIEIIVAFTMVSIFSVSAFRFSHVMNDLERKQNLYIEINNASQVITSEIYEETNWQTIANEVVIDNKTFTVDSEYSVDELTEKLDLVIIKDGIENTASIERSVYYDN